jgi:hypothetical protein
MARAMGVEVVALDMALPFTAARARNAGFRRSRELAPEALYVQFVDGDCELRLDWLPTAVAFLEGQADVGAVCGRRRERYPERSIYNLLCDLEWAVAVGPARYCGGDVLIRIAAFVQAHGYTDTMIAGEEPELCVRLRRDGWRIQVLAAEMTLHDAAMLRFSQWWVRTVRSGYAYAEGVAMHGRPPERHSVRELQRSIGWGFVLPFVTILGVPTVGPEALSLLLLYPAQFVRLVFRQTGVLRTRMLRAGFLVIGKFAEVQGAFRYWRLHLLKQRSGLIEYK